MENNERNDDGRCKLLLKYPASWWKNMWREALPAGNGTTGASVFGGVKEETILLHHTGLWHWGRKDPLPDVSHTLAETRKLIDQGKYSEASWHLSKTLTEQGYAARLASRFPLAAMQVTMHGEHAFRHYRRVLDMETGEVTVSWQDGSTSYRGGSVIGCLLLAAIMISCSTLIRSCISGYFIQLVWSLAMRAGTTHSLLQAMADQMKSCCWRLMRERLRQPLCRSCGPTGATCL